MSKRIHKKISLVPNVDEEESQSSEDEVESTPLLRSTDSYHLMPWPKPEDEDEEEETEEEKAEEAEEDEDEALSMEVVNPSLLASNDTGVFFLPRFTKISPLDDTPPPPYDSIYKQQYFDYKKWIRNPWSWGIAALLLLCIAGYQLLSSTKKSEVLPKSDEVAKLVADSKKEVPHEPTTQKPLGLKEVAKAHPNPILTKKEVTKSPTKKVVAKEPLIKETPLVAEGIYIYKEGDVLWTVARTHGQKPWTVIFNNRPKYLARCLETNKPNQCRYDRWANYLKPGDEIILFYPKNIVNQKVASVTVQPKEKTLFEVSNRVKINVWHLYWVNLVDKEAQCKKLYTHATWKCSQGAWAYRLIPGTLLKTEGSYAKASHTWKKAKNKKSSVYVGRGPIGPARLHRHKHSKNVNSSHLFIVKNRKKLKKRSHKKDRKKWDGNMKGKVYTDLPKYYKDLDYW